MPIRSFFKSLVLSRFYNMATKNWRNETKETKRMKQIRTIIHWQQSGFKYICIASKQLRLSHRYACYATTRILSTMIAKFTRPQSRDVSAAVGLFQPCCRTHFPKEAVGISIIVSTNGHYSRYLIKAQRSSALGSSLKETLAFARLPRVAYSFSSGSVYLNFL